MKSSGTICLNKGNIILARLVNLLIRSVIINAPNATMK